MLAVQTRRKRPRWVDERLQEFFTRQSSLEFFAPTVDFGFANGTIDPNEPIGVRSFQGRVADMMGQNGPTAQRPNGPTAQRPNGPTAQRPNGPTAQRPNGPTAQRPRLCATTWFASFSAFSPIRRGPEGLSTGQRSPLGDGAPRFARVPHPRGRVPPNWNARSAFPLSRGLRNTLPAASPSSFGTFEIVSYYRWSGRRDVMRLVRSDSYQTRSWVQSLTAPCFAGLLSAQGANSLCRR